MEILRVAQGASSYTVKASNASGETAFGAHTGIVAIRDGDSVANDRPARRFPHPLRRRRPAHPRARVESSSSRAPTLSGFQGNIVLIGVSAGNSVRHCGDAAVAGRARGARARRNPRPDIVGRPADAARLGAGRGVSLHFVAFGAAGHPAAVPLGAERGGRWLRRHAAASAIGSWLAFTRHGLLLDPILPTLSSGAVYLVGVTALFARKQRRRATSGRRSGAIWRPRWWRNSPPTPACCNWAASSAE